MTASIWIGDVITAWAALDRRPEDLDTIVKLLGLEPPELAPTWEPEAADPPRASPMPRVNKTMFAPMPPMAMPAASSPKPRADESPMTRVRAIAVEPIEREPLRRPVWSGGTLREPVAEVAPNRLQPLFPHATARALIGAAAHSVRQVGRVDLDAAVRIVAQRRPVHDIPRATARTMRAGIQLVIDRTWAMRPFFDDIAILRRQLSTVVGNDLVDELWFFGDLGACRRPHSIGRRSRAARDRTPRAERRAQTEAAWRPPEGEVPVIVVSDLGRADRMNGDPRVAKAWDELFRRAREAGCDVVSVVPRRINRDDCHDRTSSVAWDTRTTVGRVLAERKRARV